MIHKLDFSKVIKKIRKNRELTPGEKVLADIFKQYEGEKMKVLLEDGVWLSEGEGDPPRTLVEKNAKDFVTLKKALAALVEARKLRPFINAKIQTELF